MNCSICKLYMHNDYCEHFVGKYLVMYSGGGTTIFELLPSKGFQFKGFFPRSILVDEERIEKLLLLT